MRTASLALLALGLCAAPRAQEPPAPPEVPLATPTSGPEAFELAQRLLNNGQTSEGIALLEDLVRQQPDAFALTYRLRDAYVRAERFDDAVRVLDGWIVDRGPSADLYAERGVYLHRAGRVADAQASWDRAIQTAPDEPMTYRTVANLITQVRLFDLAAAMLERGTARLPAPDPFVLDKAQLAGLSRQYERAAELYLTYVADDQTTAPAIQARLSTYLRDPEAAPAIARAVARAAAEDPLNRAFREMSAWIALEQKDYDAALAATRALDRLENEQGRTLVGFAESAVAADALDIAARALDEAIERYPDGPHAVAARFARARLADRQSREAGERGDLGPTPHADAARDGYRALLDRPPSVEAADAAALALAELERDVRLDLDAAARSFQTALSARDPMQAGRAQVGLADVSIRQDDLDAARERYAGVEEDLVTGPLAEEARFELARIDFYDGFFLSALARLEAMDENTAADVSNDAIELRVTLKESAEEAAADSTGGHPLRPFSRAALLHRQARDTDALAVLDTLLTDASDTPLVDDALFLKADVLQSLGRPAEAVAALDALAERDPLSFFRDRALLRQADLYRGPLGDRDAAALHYERLLELFPGSLFAPEARDRLRRLRTSA